MSTTNSDLVSLQEKNGNNRKIFLLAIIMALVTVSWTGILDRMSSKFLDDTFVALPELVLRKCRSKFRFIVDIKKKPLCKISNISKPKTSPFHHFDFIVQSFYRATCSTMCKIV